MTTYYKATRPDGTDFYSGTIDYAAAVGRAVRARTPKSDQGYACCTNGVLHAADTPAETLIGGSWPCRLFEVTGNPVAQEGHKFGFRQLTIVREIEAWRTLGPNGQQVAALIDRARTLTPSETRRLAAAWDAARDAAWDAARVAAWDAAWAAARVAAVVAASDAARAAAWAAAREAREAGEAGDAADAADAAGVAARDAARALVVRDLITDTHFAALTTPWINAIGPTWTVTP